MALLYPITAAQTDAKSPIDENLMDSIRLNLDDLDSRLTLQGLFDHQFKLNGPLSYLANLPTTYRRRIDGPLISKATTFQQCLAYLEKPGQGGTLEIDVKRATRPDVMITEMRRQFNEFVTSIARVGSAINTQSITRSTAQISTQGVAQWKASINVSSVVLLSENLVRYNLASAIDSDWIVGDTVTFSSMGAAPNDGTFTIVRLNDDGGNNVIVQNASGVQESIPAGSCRLNAWAYTFTNPVSSQFAAGESALFASHPDAGNDGTLTIYAVNQSGNNIIVKNSNGVANASIGGTADVLRWIFAFSSAAPTPDYTVGESAFCQGHSSGGNNGTFVIKAVNFGGNNVVLYNTAGVVQGGVAGTVDTCRWACFFSVDPSSDITAGDSVHISVAIPSSIQGTYTVKQVNRSTSDNIVIHNASGAASVSAQVVSARMLLKFATDQSASITTDSTVHIYGSAQAYQAADGDFAVLQVNRGGGANYNAVVAMAASILEQVGPSGRVVYELKSIFTTRPSFTIPAYTRDFDDTHLKVSSNAVFHATRKTVPAGTLLFLDVIGYPNGEPENLLVQLL